MLATLRHLLDTSMFAPHGICLLWEPGLIWLHVASDAMVALAYFSIPIALTIFVWKRRDVEFGWIFWAFAAFITCCGLTHVMSIYTLWVPAYGLEGLIKAITAVASIVTAVILWPLLPKLLAIPSPAQLRDTEAALLEEGRHRREAEDILRHTQKMEAIGHLTGGVAHDFNNLLTIIIGNLEIAQHSVSNWTDQSRDRLKRVIDSAAGGAQRAVVLTQRLLAFARRQPLDPRIINVNHLVRGMSEFFRSTLGENIALDISGGAGLWPVEVDPSQMEAAILNLVVNARDAMADHDRMASGRLTIETGNAFIDEVYAQQSDIAVGQYVLVSVTDTGPGMPKEVQERAFDPFFTTKEPGQGTGLGLSQVYGFVRQSGGQVKIVSEVGRGTTIRIYLPRSSGASHETADAQGQVMGSRGDETVMVVEDDPDVRSYLVETLEGFGYQVRAASNADAALADFAGDPEPFDLLLTDIVMPGMNGRLLADEMLKRQPKLKVLFMTGYSRNAVVHQGRLESGIVLLQKPLTQAAIGGKIREMLDRR